METGTVQDNSNSGITTLQAIKWGLLSLLVLGGGGFLLSRAIRKKKADTEEMKAYAEGSEAAFAKQIKMAFDNDMAFGWGTDEEKLRAVFRAIPSRQAFLSVLKSYQKLYNRSLMRDLQDELQATEYNEMMAIIAAKPDSGNQLQPPALSATQYLQWAKRLKAAFDITYWGLPGTDEAAIKAVFLEIPTQAAFAQVGATYAHTYGRNLTSDLKSELEFWEIEPMMAIINKKPKS
jgi:hypothetical protein